MASNVMNAVIASIVSLVFLGIHAPAAVGAERPAQGEAAGPRHGISLYGDLKYGPGFTHFDYVDPGAPKGGTVKLAATGTFDNLNPYILKGVAAAGAGLQFDTLLEASADEANSRYGLIAEKVEVAPDRSWVVFTLRPEARFHDGTPVTVEDAAFTLEALKVHGHPRYRLYYKDVTSVEELGGRRLKFTFTGGANRELPLIVGQLPVMSKAYWASRNFAKTTLEPPMGSGPYEVVAVDPGRSVTYRRIKDYWASDLPVKKGRHNFDVIRYDYYRDRTVALEAFKAGEYDFRQEFVSKFWVKAYDSPALENGLITKELISHQRPAGMQAFVFNTRRSVFKDRRVRKAIAYAFDFEWTNKVLFFGAYDRIKSYFSNSELAATGAPGPDEIAILEKYRGRVPDEVFTRPYEPPSTDGSGSIRGNIIKGLEILNDAGWVVRNGVLVNGKTGRPLTFEILLVNPSFERIAGPFVRNLKRLGIRARIRTVDTSQYQNRRKNFDFDMTLVVWRQSLSPGNEQRNLWSSQSANVSGSFNFAGVRDPVVDELVDLVIEAPDRRSLVSRVRALDRVLLWGHYVIPHWHSRSSRVAYWDKFGKPRITPILGFQFDTWWIDAAKEAALGSGKAAVLAEGAGAEGAGAKGAASGGRIWIYLVAGLAGALALAWAGRKALIRRRS